MQPAAPLLPLVAVSKHTLCAHTAPITALVLSLPFNLIVSGSADGLIVLWDLHTGEVPTDYLFQIHRLTGIILYSTFGSFPGTLRLLLLWLFTLPVETLEAVMLPGCVFGLLTATSLPRLAWHPSRL